MIVIVSSELFFEDEALVFNALFENGLELLHLRKPKGSSKDYEALIEKINPEFRERIVLHQHHFLAEKYGIHRLHFSEAERHSLEGIATDFIENIVYSTSVHKISEYNALNAGFSYAFLSPLFDSISKPGYLAIKYDLNKINSQNEIKLIGLGGIHLLNCKQVLEEDYDGIGLCGAIWNAMNPVETFLKIKKQCSIIDQ